MPLIVKDTKWACLFVGVRGLSFMGRYCGVAHETEENRRGTSTLEMLWTMHFELSPGIHRVAGRYYWKAISEERSWSTASHRTGHALRKWMESYEDSQSFWKPCQELLIMNWAVMMLPVEIIVCGLSFGILFGWIELVLAWLDDGHCAEHGQFGMTGTSRALWTTEQNTCHSTRNYVRNCLEVRKTDCRHFFRK